MSMTVRGVRRIPALAAFAAFMVFTVPGAARASSVDAEALAAAKAAMDAFQKADYVHWASFYADDAIIEDVGSGNEGRRVEGKKAILEWFKVVADSWADSTYKPLRIVAEGRTVMWEWRWEGTQTADFVDARGTGRTVNFRGVTIWDMENGKVKHEVTIYNYSTLLHQLSKE
jgi:steroid delta-isomerase-like uncharacterized protein